MHPGGSCHLCGPWSLCWNEPPAPPFESRAYIHVPTPKESELEYGDRHGPVSTPSNRRHLLWLSISVCFFYLYVQVLIYHLSYRCIPFHSIALHYYSNHHISASATTKYFESGSVQLPILIRYFACLGYNE